MPHEATGPHAKIQPAIGFKPLFAHYSTVPEGTVFFWSFTMIILAHRGASGDTAENTIHAFALALDRGADAIETDTRLSSDGIPMLIHDPTIERVTTGTGYVSDWTADELRKFSAGEIAAIPTLEESLKRFPSARFNVDLKDRSEELSIAVGETIRMCDAVDRLTIASFHPETLEMFRNSFPEISTSLHAGEVKKLFLSAWFGGTFDVPKNAVSLQIPERFGLFPVVTKRLVRCAHDAGLRVEPWTINDEAALRRVKRAGVDGVFTDFPERIKTILTTMEQQG